MQLNKLTIWNEGCETQNDNRSLALQYILRLVLLQNIMAPNQEQFYRDKIHETWRDFPFADLRPLRKDNRKPLLRGG